MSLGTKLQIARAKKKLKQSELAENLGVTVQAISQWENDRTVPGVANMRKLMEILDIDLNANLNDVSQILNVGIGVSAPLIKEVPTLFFAPGNQDTRNDNWLDWDEMPFGKPVERLTINWTPKGNIFAITVKDGSMAPNFLEGDYLIIDSGMPVRPGEYAFFNTRGSNGIDALRKLRVTGVNSDGKRIMELIPLNPDFPTLRIIEGEDGEITGGLAEHRRVYAGK